MNRKENGERGGSLCKHVTVLNPEPHSVCQLVSVHDKHTMLIISNIVSTPSTFSCLVVSCQSKLCPYIQKPPLTIC